jgi:hypothetical protein
VVAAEHQRHRTGLERLQGRLVECLADRCDLPDVLLLPVDLLLRFGNRCWQIAFVDDGAAQRCDLVAQAGDAKG